MKKISVLVLLGLFWGPLQAEVVKNLYNAQVPVAQRGQAALKDAAAEGLRQVLVRVSGREDVASFGDVQRALPKAESLLNQYHYSNKLIDGRDQLFIDFSFSEVEVNRLLSQAGLPVWDKNRPQTLVWLVVDDFSGRHFVSEASDPEIVQALREAAAQRGLPLVFPVLDIDDKLQLTTGQVWSMDLEAVRKAAERYRTSQILTGRLTRLSTSWIANFAVISGIDEDLLDRQAPELADILRPVVNSVADELASRFAVIRSGQSGAREHIVVSGIGNFRDYARLLTYLEGVAVVEHANPVWVSGAQAVIELHLEGSMDKARQFFLLDKKLLDDNNPGVAFTQSNLPVEQVHSYYRWQSRP
ncbi:DUF2066 domain-containing protein [Litorivivens sp.]|uniref:DUF2066 domain-containing protein n=1 Tax=Litorivivens sp. TaxID=2020868 RepID=UPI00356830DA